MKVKRVIRYKLFLCGGINRTFFFGERNKLFWKVFPRVALEKVHQRRSFFVLKNDTVRSELNIVFNTRMLQCKKEQIFQCFPEAYQRANIKIGKGCAKCEANRFLEFVLCLCFSSEIEKLFWKIDRLPDSIAQHHNHRIWINLCWGKTAPYVPKIADLLGRPPTTARARRAHAYGKSKIYWDTKGKSCTR